MSRRRVEVGRPRGPGRDTDRRAQPASALRPTARTLRSSKSTRTQSASRRRAATDAGRSGSSSRTAPTRCWPTPGQRRGDPHGEYLYCANQGNPVTPTGAGAILSAYRSAKRGPEIGRFGLGFKSVLGVSRTPEFFSRSGSFGFDPEFAASEIRKVVGRRRRGARRSGSRCRWTPRPQREGTRFSPGLMEWATTVVRLPLDEGRGEWLHDDLLEFPAQFLVFSPHISELVLDDRVRGKRRSIQLQTGARPVRTSPA